MVDYPLFIPGMWLDKAALPGVETIMYANASPTIKNPTIAKTNGRCLGSSKNSPGFFRTRAKIANPVEITRQTQKPIS